jgi:hypothetical protein
MRLPNPVLLRSDSVPPKFCTTADPAAREAALAKAGIRT